MNEDQKQTYRQKYQEAKQKGVKFWPDIIYKDLLVSFGLFLLLIGLAAFVGVHPEPKADPSDATYVPRPEWYFLFLFEFLKFIPGEVEWLGTFVIPVIGVILLFALPFFDRGPERHWRGRLTGISVMGLVVIGMIGLTIRAVITTPKNEGNGVAATINGEILTGQDLYSIQCVECHGPDGEGGEIQGVEGLEGTILKSISSRDEMYTRSDDTLYAIIDYGQQELGMPPYGLAYGGPLKRGEIEAVVTFMRYTWDDRVELPQEAASAGAVPELSQEQIPSYESHIAPITKRYCISCHRPGKENNNYLMETYQEILTTGDHSGKNVIPGDLNSYLIQTINGVKVLDPDTGEEIQQMPPTKLMKDEYIQIFERWILNGMPDTDSDVESLLESTDGE